MRALREHLVEIAVEVKTKDNQWNLLDALGPLSAKDLFFGVAIEDNHIIISASSESDLETGIRHIESALNIDLNVGRPQVAYRETFTKTVEYTYTHKKQTGGSGQYAEVKIIFEPRERSEGFEFIDKVVGGAIPREFIPSVQKGLTVQKEEGVLAGYPTVDFRATLVDGKYHDVDSNALTFEIAARACFREAIKTASPILLEPVMKVEVVSPEEFMSELIAGLKKRGEISSVVPIGVERIITALAPLANMLGYARSIRLLSQGRATCVMKFDHYASALPPDDTPFRPALRMRV